MEAIDWRCANCGGFHEYGNCPYYEAFNPWNPPYHQYYGEHEYQPLEQEEPHQGQGNGGKKSIEELLEELMIRTEDKYKAQEAAIKENQAALNNLGIQLQKMSMQLTEEAHSSSLSDASISLEEHGEELQIEDKGDCELIEESLTPQALEEDEEEESPEEASEDFLELECDNLVERQKEQVVGYDDLKEVPIVDFVFGDKLMVNKEKPLSLSIYLMNLWNKGTHVKEQTRGEAIVSTTWKQISENFFNSLTLNLIFAAMISEYACNVMILLCKNLHDLSDLSQFAIDPG